VVRYVDRVVEKQVELPVARRPATASSIMNSSDTFFSHMLVREAIRLRDQGRYEEALDKADLSLRIDPSDPDAQRLISSMLVPILSTAIRLRDEGKLQAALEKTDLLLRIDPSDEGAKELRAEINRGLAESERNKRR